MPIKPLHERMKEAREKIPGLSKYKLAKDSGVSESLVGKIENDVTVPLEETLAKLAPVLGIPLVEILDWLQEERERRALGEDQAVALRGQRLARRQESGAITQEPAAASNPDPDPERKARAAAAFKDGKVKESKAPTYMTRQIGQASAAASSEGGNPSGRHNAPLGDFDEVDGEEFSG